MTALRLANERVFESGESEEQQNGMGTTAVVVLIEQNRLIYAGVGDSRIYSSLGGELRQLTRDDSWVSQILAHQPDVNQALLREHPMRNVLTKVIGPKETIELTVQERPLTKVRCCSCAATGFTGRSGMPQSARFWQAVPEWSRWPNGWSRRRSRALPATTSPPWLCDTSPRFLAVGGGARCRACGSILLVTY